MKKVVCILLCVCILFACMLAMTSCEYEHKSYGVHICYTDGSSDCFKTVGDEYDSIDYNWVTGDIIIQRSGGSSVYISADRYVSCTTYATECPICHQVLE